MKIPYFCCIGAELKRYAQDFDFMNQVYLYKVPTDDNIDEVLSEDYFKAISNSVLQDDIVYIYEASAETLHECRFDKQNGHITAVPLASDETLTGAVTSIIHDNLTPNKLLKSDENGKVAASDFSENDFVKKAGDTMTGALNIADIASSNTPLLTLTHSNTTTYKWNIAPRYNSTTLSIYPGSTETNGYRFATTGFVPASNDARYLGSASLKWKGVYTAMLNNGGDLIVPAVSGTLATKADVDLAANSGRMITDQGVWYAKMYAATVAPSAADGTNYADFSQVDGQGNPIIVTYNRVNGAWVQDQTITPPAEYDGYVPITSKIWDIPEQAGQQGGRILWNHTSKQFTPSPQIVSFDSIEITGNSTVVMPQNPTGSSIVNKDYVDNAIANSGTGRNVGDIFLTMRNDNELNGAVECDGSPYNTTDFTGAQSIGQLLSAGKVPYVSLSAYADEITAKGWCDKFGWDGAGTTAFKVPTLNAYIWQKLNTPVVGTGKGLGIVGVNTGTWAGRFNGQGNNGTDYVILNTFNVDPGTGGGGDWVGSGAIGVVTDPTKSALTTDTTGNISDQRVMVQLAISATDEALETCTGVLADVAANTAAIAGADYVVESQLPTAANNYIWYRKYKSGWVEQGGRDDTGTGTKTINLPITMQDEYYTVTTATMSSTATHGATVQNPTTTTVQLVKSNSLCYWEVKGMAA